MGVATFPCMDSPSYVNRTAPPRLATSWGEREVYLSPLRSWAYQQRWSRPRTWGRNHRNPLLAAGRSVILFHSSDASFMACSAVFVPEITAWTLLSSVFSYSARTVQVERGHRVLDGGSHGRHMVVMVTCHHHRVLKVRILGTGRSTPPGSRP